MEQSRQTYGWQGDRLYIQEKVPHSRAAEKWTRHQFGAEKLESAEAERMWMKFASPYIQLARAAFSIFPSAIKTRARQGANAAWLLLQYLHLPGAALYFAPIFQNTLRAQPCSAWRPIYFSVEFFNNFRFIPHPPLTIPIRISRTVVCEPQMQMHFARAILWLGRKCLHVEHENRFRLDWNVQFIFIPSFYFLFFLSIKLSIPKMQMRAQPGTAALSWSIYKLWLI